MSAFPPRPTSAPAFAGTRAGPGHKYAVDWVKKRLRFIHREARGAGRDSPLNEAAAHLYLLIATCVLDRRFISEPIRLQELAGIMHCEPITVTRARKRLMALGELQLVTGGQGKAYVRFALPKMAGPLYAEKGGAAAAAGAPTSITESEVTSITESEVAAASSPQLPSQSQKYPPTSIPELEVGDGTYKVLEEEDLSSSLAAKVERFIDWWIPNYRRHRAGVANRIRHGDREAAFRLLDGRTIERAQAMARLWWEIDADSRWLSDNDRLRIIKSDRAIAFLESKATIIEQEVVRRELDEPPASADADVWSDIAQRIAMKVIRHDYLTWFQEVQLVRDGGDVIEVAAADAAYIQKNYGDVVREAVEAVRPGARVAFVPDAGARRTG